MRRTVLAALGGFLALSSTSCSESARPVLAEVAWQLTCTGTPVGACTPTQFPNSSNPRYDFRGNNGEVVTDRISSADLGVLAAECRATDLGGGVVQIYVRATTNNGSFEVQGLNVNRTSGAYQPSACVATFEDTLSTYGNTSGAVSLGGCSDQAPSAATPCQISNIVINHGDPDGPSFDFQMLCNALPNQSLPAVKASVRDSMQQASPAFFHFANCSGI